MNYRILPLNDKFAVVENHTKQIMKYFVKREEAKKFTKRLNLGAGFDGWSPCFITTRERVN